MIAICYKCGKNGRYRVTFNNGVSLDACLFHSYGDEDTGRVIVRKLIPRED